MIVVSLLLILVAVTLLALGLTGGSSTLLISSIVASLLAAVALVIGARQNAGRRAAADGAAPDPAAPEFAAEAAPPERSTDDFAGPGPVFAAESAESDLSDRRETIRLDAVDENGGNENLGGHFDAPVLDERDAFEAGRRDAAAAMAAAAGARREEEPDYDRAAEAIHSARAEGDDEPPWRTHAEPAAASASAFAEPAVDEQEFADADEDDPADEPLPQAVSPSDAVRVARLDAEVLVVDGRPRYHLPDCAHLVGRLTEPIPVNEAVELGFSPCGLCRPVDRLVAAAVRH